MTVTFKLRGIDKEVDLERTGQLRALYRVMCEVNDDVPHDVKVFCFSKDTNAWAYWPERLVSVSPYFFRAEEGKLWSPRHSAWLQMPKRKGFVMYALAHELAHVRVYDAGDRKAEHGIKFMTEFKKLCPEEYQHWEYAYKPETAFEADVNADKADL